MKYNVFICYKRQPADELAKRLKEALGDYDISAFVDYIDIPKKYKSTDKWWDYRDQAIHDCGTFAMIVTVGFEKSPEIAKEIKLARDENKRLMYFRWSNLEPDLVINLGDETLNTKDWEQIEFSEAGELVRKSFDNYREEEVKAPKTRKEEVIQFMLTSPPSQQKRPPLVHFEITQSIRNTTIRRKLPDIGFNIRNWSDHPIRAWVKARVILG
jgi:arsenate reductase-like glutaredoxin family protein